MKETLRTHTTLADSEKGTPINSAFKNDLVPYEFNNKGTIRFPLSEPVPVKLIEGIARFRAKEVAGRKKATPTATKKR
jgi:uncharacterized protein YdhG (YjbR/CyaY superfamily)